MNETHALICLIHDRNNDRYKDRLQWALDILAEFKGLTAIADVVFVGKYSEAFLAMSKISVHQSHVRNLYPVRVVLIPCQPQVFGVFQSELGKALADQGLQVLGTDYPPSSQ
jgi:hypothetical protein